MTDSGNQPPGDLPRAPDSGPPQDAPTTSFQQVPPQQFNQGQPPKKGMSTGGKIAIGCGVLFLLGLLAVGGCTAAVAIWGGDQADELSRSFEEGFGQTSGVDVTLEEYNRVQNGMTLQEVETVFGAPGAETSTNEVSGMTIKVISWDGNGTFSTATITFENERVVNKLQFGLE